MSTRRVDYDEVAPTYDQRYAQGGPEGLASALSGLMHRVGARTALEVGCGTGHWLAAMQASSPHLVGLDLSLEMLRRAQERQGIVHLALGDANKLPFRHGAFDVVYCVHTLHHLDHPEKFVHDAQPLIRPGGALAIVGIDPHTDRDHWYLYDYFPGTRETDLARYPPAGAIVDWMVAAGFDRATWRQVGQILDTQFGRDLLASPFLHKHGTSQLALLTGTAYDAGMARIRAALDAAETAGETLAFPVEIALYMVTGFAGDECGICGRMP